MVEIDFHCMMFNKTYRDPKMVGRKHQMNNYNNKKRTTTTTKTATTTRTTKETTKTAEDSTNKLT